MRLYRAMSREEWRATQALGRPAYIGRWKWFSPDRVWVQARVMDGEFNNSRFVPDRYCVLVEFQLRGSEEKWFAKNRGCCHCGKREWALHKRQAHQVQWLGVSLVMTLGPLL